MKKYMKAILPKGFKASGVRCGIKRSGKLDLALFYSEVPAKCSGLFTSNKMPAAPVILDRIYLKGSSRFQAIIANSGNANCFNAITGLKDARLTSVILEEALGLNSQSVLVASTGIIGKRLPIDRIKSAIPDLINKLSPQGINEAKKAILTTDTFVKEFSVKFRIGAKEVSICGIAKGAGMIAPNMATLLVFIFTDASITRPALDKALKIAVGKSFNCITVDGCMSTNDSVLLMANGLSGNALIDSGSNFLLFSQALNAVTLELAKMVIRDAEGASKFIQIKVRKAKNPDIARKAALGIANSSLFKTAVYGENPNFGRIVAALGAHGIKVAEKDLRIKVSSLKKRDIFVDVVLNQGNSEAVVYTSDLTPEYVKINAEYS